MKTEVGFNKKAVDFWEHGQGPVELLCIGEPGIGKVSLKENWCPRKLTDVAQTVLSDQLMRDMKQAAKKSNALVLSLYLDYHRESSQSIESALRLLLYQIVKQDPSDQVSKPLEELYEASQRSDRHSKISLNNCYVVDSDDFQIAMSISFSMGSRKSRRLKLSIYGKFYPK